MRSSAKKVPIERNGPNGTLVSEAAFWKNINNKAYAVALKEPIRRVYHTPVTPTNEPIPAISSASPSPIPVTPVRFL